MLVTIVYFMYQAIEWLRWWRCSVRCMRLISEQLHRSSVIVQRTDGDKTAMLDRLALLIGDSTPVARVLWTCNSRQLAVMSSQVEKNFTLSINTNSCNA